MLNKQHGRTGNYLHCIFKAGNMTDGDKKELINLCLNLVDRVPLKVWHR